MGNVGIFGKAAFLVGMLAGLGLMVMAVVLFRREGDWHARYLYFGIMIWFVTLIGLRMRLPRAG